MVASRKTVYDVAAVIRRHVSRDKARDLILDLQTVQGNRSFDETIDLLNDVLSVMPKGEPDPARAEVTELDFTGLTAREKNGLITPGLSHVVLLNGRYHAGVFSPVWFGWNMPVQGMAMTSRQFDPPGTNGCHTQRVWRVDEAAGLTQGESLLLSAGLDPVAIRRDSEEAHARDQRRYAIDHGMHYRGKRITEESPLEAYLYRPTAEIMPPPYQEDEDED